MPWLDALLERPPVTWRDLIDIAIVSIVVYEVLKLIRGTRAAQMAVALGLIVGTFYLSRALELQTVNWLIRNLVGYVVFAAIVLLQTDIRRALVHLGRGPFFRYLRRVEADEDAIEELVVALEKLAAERIGALVIVERGIGLRNHIESGILLDARLTYDLIVAVFQPSSPLHDGAVIVQGDRVAAAACFLPLSINPKLARELGSRHRAAVGVTEENDAVALVVSEETGAVSLVVDGRVDRHQAPDQLRQRLRGLLKRSQLGAERRLAVATMD
ncbi:MAG: diadenylate cyclase CdaA [Vicinamibacterales bacterium]